MFKLQHNLVMSSGEMQFCKFQYFTTTLPADSLKEDKNLVSMYRRDSIRQSCYLLQPTVDFKNVRYSIWTVQMLGLVALLLILI